MNHKAKIKYFDDLSIPNLGLHGKFSTKHTKNKCTNNVNS